MSSNVVAGSAAGGSGGGAGAGSAVYREVSAPATCDQPWK